MLVTNDDDLGPCLHEDLEEYDAGAICNSCNLMVLRPKAATKALDTPDDDPVEDVEMEVQLHDPD